MFHTSPTALLVLIILFNVISDSNMHICNFAVPGVKLAHRQLHPAFQYVYLTGCSFTNIWNLADYYTPNEVFKLFHGMSLCVVHYLFQDWLSHTIVVPRSQAQPGPEGGQSSESGFRCLEERYHEATE